MSCMAAQVCLNSPVRHDGVPMVGTAGVPMRLWLYFSQAW